MGLTSLRPLQFRGIVDTALGIYRSYFVALVRPILLFFAPLYVLVGVVQAYVDTEGPISTTTTNAAGVKVTHVNAGALWTNLGVVAMVLVVNALATWLAQATCVLTVADAYLGTDPDWRKSFDFARRRFGKVAWVSLLSLGGFLLGLLLFVVPGIAVYVMWVIAVPTVLLEGLAGTRALGRSRQLVRGRWWPTFGPIALISLMILVVAAFVRAVTTDVVGGAFGHGTAASAIGATIGSALTEVFLFPVLACVILVLYFDLRVRKEGFDLDLLAREVGISDWSGSPGRLAPVGGYGYPGSAPAWQQGARGSAQSGGSGTPSPGGWGPPAYPGDRYPGNPHPGTPYPGNPYPGGWGPPPRPAGTQPPYPAGWPPPTGERQAPPDGHWPPPGQWPPPGEWPPPPDGQWQPPGQGSWPPPQPGQGSWPPPPGSWPPPAPPYPQPWGPPPPWGKSPPPPWEPQPPPPEARAPDAAPAPLWPAVSSKPVPRPKMLPPRGNTSAAATNVDEEQESSTDN
jgi:hypothetical protein